MKYNKPSIMLSDIYRYRFFFSISKLSSYWSCMYVYNLSRQFAFYAKWLVVVVGRNINYLMSSSVYVYQINRFLRLRPMKYQLNHCRTSRPTVRSASQGQIKVDRDFDWMQMFVY